MFEVARTRVGPLVGRSTGGEIYEISEQFWITAPAKQHAALPHLFSSKTIVIGDTVEWFITVGINRC